MITNNNNNNNYEWTFLYALVKDITNNLELFNNTHVFEPNILKKLFSVLSEWLWLTDWLRRVPEVDQSVTIQLPSAEDGERFLRNIRFKNVSFDEQF